MFKFSKKLLTASEEYIQNLKLNPYVLDANTISLDISRSKRKAVKKSKQERVKIKSKITNKNVENEIKEEIINNNNELKKKVLVVDDNKLNIKVAARTLQDFNFEIDEAISGFECLEKVKLKDYDLILMDIMMPEMSGEETIKELQKNKDFKTPVMAVTADAVVGAKERYLDEGFVDYLPKPFTKEQMTEKINKILK